jgi:hypothetical protein
MLHATARTLLTSLVLATAVAANATVIYRWVDEDGRTHVSDVVPDKYKKSATRIDSTQYEASPAQRKEAQERAAKEKALVEEAAKRRASAPPSAPASVASAPAAAKRPAQGVTDSTDCETWWRLYHESEECFGAYRTVRGGLKPEAFEMCNPIPSPKPKCGPFTY